MTFDEFERHARREWERIPDSYKEGIDGLVVERDAKPHPDAPEVYTLGECTTESYPSDFGGPDTIRSVVVLYYGSFLRLSRLDDTFDWEEEVWETLTHELQHHLESLAHEDALIDLDYAVDQGFRRYDGESFDPFYYRAGEAIGDGVYRVEKHLYFELPLDAGVADAVFELEGERYRVPVEDIDSDVLFLDVTGGLPRGADPVTVVLVRRSDWRRTLRALFRRSEPAVREREVSAHPATGGSGA